MVKHTINAENKNNCIDNHKPLSVLNDHFTVYHAAKADLFEIVSIYNQSIAAKQSTADLQPVTVEQRQAWFNQHQPDKHPIYIVKDQQD